MGKNKLEKLLAIAVIATTLAVTSCAKTEYPSTHNTSEAAQVDTDISKESTATTPNRKTSQQQHAEVPEQASEPKPSEVNRLTEIQLQKSPATGYKVKFNGKTYYSRDVVLTPGKLVFDPEVQQYANITNQLTMVTEKAKLQQLKEVLLQRDELTGVYSLGDTTINVRVKNRSDMRDLLQSVKKQFPAVQIEVGLFYSGRPAF